MLSDFASGLEHQFGTGRREGRIVYHFLFFLVYFFCPLASVGLFAFYLLGYHCYKPLDRFLSLFSFFNVFGKTTFITAGTWKLGYIYMLSLFLHFRDTRQAVFLNTKKEETQQCTTQQNLGEVNIFFF